MPLFWIEQNIFGLTVFPIFTKVWKWWIQTSLSWFSFVNILGKKSFVGYRYEINYQEYIRSVIFFRKMTYWNDTSQNSPKG